MLEAWFGTDVGLKRDSNQDSVLVLADDALFIVADGMGGHSGGEVASRMAVEAVQEAVARSLSAGEKLDARTLLTAAFREASRRIFVKGEVESPKLKGMGTTLVAGLYRDGIMTIANVGDSRAYLFADPFLWQITEDHSLINEHIRAGVLNEQNAHRYVGRNVITRSVGFEKHVECDIIERTMRPGEMILMCSDGLSGLVEDRRLLEICRNVAPDKVVDQCINEAKANGGDDNISVILIRING